MITFQVLLTDTINQSSALHGGTLFEYGDSPHAQGSLKAFSGAVDRVRMMTVFVTDRMHNKAYVQTADLNCMQARNIAAGSYNHMKESEKSSVHWSATQTMVAFLGLVPPFIR